MRLDSPPRSAPSTERLAVLPVAGLGLALATVATVGPGFATVTLAEPWIVPTAAFTLTLVRLCARGVPSGLGDRPGGGIPGERRLSGDGQAELIERLGL